MNDSTPPDRTTLTRSSQGAAHWLASLTRHAFQLRSQHRYALHPVEAALQYHCAQAEVSGEESHGSIDFQEAEAHYRAGAQGIRLPEIPKLPQQLRELSRLGQTDRAARKALRIWAEEPHVEVDTTRPLVGKSETDDLMAAMGFAPVQLIHDGILDDGYYAYLHPLTGVLAHDLHDENVVRLPETDDLAVIDPYISLARRGTWGAIKLAEVGHTTPPDDVTAEK